MKKAIAKLYAPGIMFIFVCFLEVESRAQLSQQPETGKTISTPANSRYDKARKFKRIMLGEHYRKEWAAAVDIEILDMDAEAGGLTPIKAGGGLQTKSLRLKGKNDKEYVLRSVNKDPSKAIVAELRGTFAEDIVQDQISSGNPYAPMVVASLAKAAGIFHSTPKMVYVPNSTRLGEYAADFAETVCLLEERPSGNEEDNPAYGYAKKVVNSEKLFEKIFTDNDHQVEEKAFLKARLFDMLIGDWDRHEDQWQWAVSVKDGRIFYHPIPRDRDQAFAKIDGIIPKLATKKWGIRKVQHFDYRIRDIAGLNSNGMHLDRNFTTRLTLDDWKDTAEELQDAITNEVITSAFLKMPDAIYNIDGKKLEAILRQRRDELQIYAFEYYHFLSKEINITGTSGKEIFEVTRLNDDKTKVVIYNAVEIGKGNKKFFERTFLRTETKEIRLYGIAGNDIYNIEGKTPKGILIRVIGGKGDNYITDNSFVKQMGAQTKIYDDNNNFVLPGKDTKQYISTEKLTNEYNRKSFMFDLLSPAVNPGFNPDDGIFIGGGLIYKRQHFGKSPFAHMQNIGGNYAFSTGAYSIWYKGIFTSLIGKSDLHLDAKFNSPTYTRNFYGFGNETINNDEADKNYYRVRISQISFFPSLHRKLGNKHSIIIGAGFTSNKVENNENRFVSSAISKLDSTTFDRKKYASTQLGYEFNTLNNNFYPTKGLKLVATASYIQNTDDKEKHFVRLLSDFSFYTTKGNFTLGQRIGVSTNTGNQYEFFQANYLGGLTNLRGFRRDRFAGKTSLFSNTELRVRVSDLNVYLLKGPWGLLGFFDNGRVWMPEEHSDKWHYSYGGGVWYPSF